MPDGAGVFPDVDPKRRSGKGKPRPPSQAVGVKSHVLGHRQRLRQRFLDAGPEALPDYELLELLLFMALPRGDVKPLAKTLLARFGSFAQVISAGPAEIEQTPGAGPSVTAALKTVQAAAVRLLRDAATEKPVLSNWTALTDYCRAAMRFEKTEQTRLLFLDRKNRLITDEVQQRGTVDHTPVYPREVARRGLELGACAIILIHNHPSGDPSPSQGDIDMTHRVKAALAAVGIALHDHLIIGGADYISFRDQGLL